MQVRILPPEQHAALAHLVEHSPDKREVPSPNLGSCTVAVAQWLSAGLWPRLCEFDSHRSPRGSIVQWEDSALARRRSEFNSPSIHRGAIVQREDAGSADQRSGFNSPWLHHRCAQSVLAADPRIWVRLPAWSRRTRGSTPHTTVMESTGDGDPTRLEPAGSLRAGRSTRLLSATSKVAGFVTRRRVHST
jgi:hypothetical protein